VCWHALDAAAVLARVESGLAGLGDAEHARRLAVFGPNLPAGQRKREPWWEELGEAVSEPPQLLLIAVAVPSAVFGELRDAIAIAVVIAAVAVTETVTELRAARAIEALRGMTAPVARLRREGWTAEVPAASLVPGDIRGRRGRGYRASRRPGAGRPRPAGRRVHPDRRGRAGGQERAAGARGHRAG
jgi:Ca2+-transporting ATPase